ncbi:hypothetical protein MRX96_011205 [Rhipicephalus microplus]
MGKMPDQEQSLPFVDVSPLHRIPLVFVNLLVFAVSCMVAFACISSIVDRGSEISFRRRSLLVSFVVNRDITALLFSLLMMVIAFTGFVGALRENVGFLQCYIQGTCLLILLDILFVAATVTLPYLTKNKAHSIFSIELIVSYRDNPDYGKLVDYAQSTFECCGVTSERYRDWDQNLYFNCSKTNPSVERCSVPSSCCKPPDGDDVDTRLRRRFCGSGVLAGTEQQAWSKTRFQSFVGAHTIVVLGVGIGIYTVIAALHYLATSVHDEILSLTHLYDRYYQKLNQGYPAWMAGREVAQEMSSADRRLVIRGARPTWIGRFYFRRY